MTVDKSKFVEKDAEIKVMGQVWRPMVDLELWNFEATELADMAFHMVHSGSLPGSEKEEILSVLHELKARVVKLEQELLDAQ